MALKRPLALLNLPSPLRNTTCIQCRTLHKINAPRLAVPSPTPFVPDVQTFMTLIGRDMHKHAAKIPSWEALFTLSSEQLKESGIEPPRARRYLLWWRDRYRKGIYGMGGDLKYVKDGAAALQVVQVPATAARSPATLTKDEGYKKVVSNVPASVIEPGKKIALKGILSKLAPPPKVEESDFVPVRGINLVNAGAIGGTGVEYRKGHPGVAVLKVKDGLWEQRRGHKVDGGERRKAEVRAKRAAAERNSR